MDFTILSGYILALLVGISLGLVGSGGSILTVPILVYVVGFDAVTATGYSLFVVGSTALVGGLKCTLQKNVDFTTVAIFGLPSLLAAYLIRAFVIPIIPNKIAIADLFVITKSVLLMVLFAVIMLLAAIKMIRSVPLAPDTCTTSPLKLGISGIATGIIAGTVGAGGGFLIIPALVFLAAMPMRRAIGTSLFIIAIQSLAGFMGDAATQVIDWAFLLPFTSSAIVGILVGIFFSGKIDGEKLKTGFGYFVLLMGIYIIAKELLLN